MLHYRALLVARQWLQLPRGVEPYATQYTVEDMNQASQSLVTVIVPCYNDGGYILESLESLCQQAFKNFEVLVINDGSTDPKTLEILESVCNRFPSLDMKVISQENQGPSGARNHGVRKASGQWIMMLDADDKLSSEHLRMTVSLARKKNLDFVSTDYQNFGAQNYVTRVNINFYDELFANRILGCSLFKKSVLIEQPYDPAFRHGYEDWELWIRLMKKGYQGEVIHEPLYFYRRRKESRFTKSYFQRSQHIRQIRQKHKELFTSACLAKIKNENHEDRVVTVWTHDLHYHLGLQFPRLAAMLMRVYMALRPFMTRGF
jgi:glycosyltransferase involved in cell wall biosynthesis